MAVLDIDLTELVLDSKCWPHRSHLLITRVWRWGNQWPGRGDPDWTETDQYFLPQSAVQSVTALQTSLFYHHQNTSKVRPTQKPAVL